MFILQTCTIKIVFYIEILLFQSFVSCSGPLVNNHTCKDICRSDAKLLHSASWHTCHGLQWDCSQLTCHSGYLAGTSIVLHMMAMTALQTVAVNALNTKWESSVNLDSLSPHSLDFHVYFGDILIFSIVVLLKYMNTVMASLMEL